MKKKEKLKIKIGLNEAMSIKPNFKLIFKKDVISPLNQGAFGGNARIDYPSEHPPCRWTTTGDWCDTNNEVCYTWNVGCTKNDQTYCTLAYD